MSTTPFGCNFCEGKHIYPFPMVSNTSSMIPFVRKGKEVKIVCVRRKDDPFKGRLALAGGFLNAGKETLRMCASRELMEEANISVNPDDFFFVTEQSAPDRDPRGHVIDHVWAYQISDNDLLNAKAGDDAVSLELFTLNDGDWKKAYFQTLGNEAFCEKFAFDHGKSVLEFYRQLEDAQD